MTLYETIKISLAEFLISDFLLAFLTERPRVQSWMTEKSSRDGNKKGDDLTGHPPFARRTFEGNRKA
jgi:hypothetical protein